MASLLRMGKEQLILKRYDATERLDGRTVIVTGSNTGLGYHAAVQLATLNPARLILAVRSLEKGNRAAESLKEKSAYKGDLQVWQLDMASFASVAAFIDRANAELDRIDILLANAAVALFKFQLTQDGHEEMTQVNTISTGLLAVGLLPKIAESASKPVSGPSASFKPHVTIVGSDAHFFARFNERKSEGSLIAALDDEKQFNALDRYNVTKVLSIFLSQQIAQLPLAKDVVVNVVNPGLCVSELRRDVNVVVGKVLDALALSGDEGAKNLSWAATADTNESGAGCYISATRPAQPSRFVRSQEGSENERKFWAEVKDLWHKVAPAQVKTVIS